MIPAAVRAFLLSLSFRFRFSYYFLVLVSSLFLATIKSSALVCWLAMFGLRIHCAWHCMAKITLLVLYSRFVSLYPCLVVRDRKGRLFTRRHRHGHCFLCCGYRSVGMSVQREEHKHRSREGSAQIIYMPGLSGRVYLISASLEGFEWNEAVRIRSFHSYLIAFDVEG